MNKIIQPTPEQIKDILAKHAKYRAGEEGGERANLRGANLDGANLDGANLTGAYLTGAYLTGANLDGANLDGANLTGAYLTGAYLTGANLDGANLDGANLTGAYLRGANLTGANLRGAYLTGGTTLPTGETFAKYLAEVLPALLIAGGKTIDDIIGAKAWDCHDWANCPMHAAFDIKRAAEGPALLVPRIEQFVQLFDAGLLPAPVKDAGGAWVFNLPAPPNPAEPAKAAD